MVIAGGATVEFKDQKVAYIEYSFIDAFRQSLEITGDKGYITIHDFVLPDVETEAAYELVVRPPNYEAQCMALICHRRIVTYHGMKLCCTFDVLILAWQTNRKSLQ